MTKQKMYAAIKIGGFALSIAACLLIALYIKDELSYDKNWAMQIVSTALQVNTT